MSVNHYFQAGKGIWSSEEQLLYEDLILEGLKIYGQDIYYLPRSLINRDLILGEDSLSKFDDSYLLEMYMETTEGFAGQQEIINKFGLEIREDTTFMLAKRRWQDAVDSVHTMIKEGRPNEGDIIYMPLMNSFFWNTICWRPRAILSIRKFTSLQTKMYSLGIFFRKIKYRCNRYW